jgi:alkaline phosphatase D
MPDEASGGTDRGVERRDVLRGMAGLSTAPFLVSSVAGAELSAGPSGVHVAYGRDPASTVRVGWTGGPATDARVEIGRPGEPKTTVDAAATPLPGREAVAYSVTVTGLAPDTDYEYVAALDDRRSEAFTVSTASDDGDGFTVTAVGDHGIADPENPFQRPGTDDPERVMATAASLDPDVQLLPGDISYANGKPSTWELYFDEHEDFYAETPFMTAPGNHEAEPGTGLLQYDRRLNDLMPIYDPLGPDDVEHEQRWYRFDYDNTRFISLSTTTDGCGDVSRGEEFVPIYDPRCEAGGVSYGDVQEQYLRSVLEDAAADDDLKWTVVYFHGPLWTDSPDHAPRDLLRDRWGSLFDDYGVDLVLCGDNHVWERTKPIEAKPGREDYAPDEAWNWESDEGTTFVTNGTGGVSHYGFGNRTPGDYLARRTNDHFGVASLDIDDDRIRVEYVTHETDDDGDPIVADAFEIRKSDERTDRGVRRPKQLDRYDGPLEDSLVVEGIREDDGSVFTGGQTNRISLTFDATREVRIRDRIPQSWDVIAGDATETDDSAPGDTRWVYFDGAGGESGSVEYFVEVPEGAAATGQYTFGPVQARADDRQEWVSVPGTESEETVIGPSTET